MSDPNKEVLDLVSQVEAQLLATQAAIRCILAADPGLRNTVARELEQVRVSRPGRVVSDSVFAAMDRAIRRMIPADLPENEAERDLA
jgi:hypothetical protein